MTGDVTLDSSMSGQTDERLRGSQGEGQLQGRSVVMDQQTVRHLRGIIDEIQNIKVATLADLDVCIGRVTEAPISGEILAAIRTRRQFLGLGDRVIEQKSVQEELQTIKTLLENWIDPRRVVAFRKDNCSPKQVQAVYAILRRYSIGFLDDEWNALPRNVADEVDYDKYIQFLKVRKFEVTQESSIADQIQQQAERRFLVSIWTEYKALFPELAQRYPFFQNEPSIEGYRSFIHSFNADYHVSLSGL